MPLEAMPSSSSGSEDVFGGVRKKRALLSFTMGSWWRRPKLFTLVCVAIVALIGVAIVFTVGFSGPITERALYEGAGNQDGLVFVGHVFNVDIKQRQLSIEWQPAGCGSFYNRTESSYSLENDGTVDNCGRISMPVNVYINGQDQPVWAYDPSQDTLNVNPISSNFIPALRGFIVSVPISIYTYSLPLRGTKKPQFVTQEFLHPFGVWETKQSYLALSPSSAGSFAMSDNTTTFQALPILEMSAIDSTDDFVPTKSFAVPVLNARVPFPNGTWTDQAYVLMTTIQYSVIAKIFCMAIFFINWFLTILVMGLTIKVVFHWKRSRGRRTGVKQDSTVLLFPITVIFSIPQLRALFVGDPAFGILLDAVGILLQIIIVSLCGGVLLIVLNKQLPEETLELEPERGALLCRERNVRFSPKTLDTGLNLESGPVQVQARFGRVPTFLCRYGSSMISDFFHPNVGGVENHIYMLSANLIRKGHKVIVITHSHPPDRVGIRWLLPSLKVYYLPFVPIASSATLPNFFTFLPYFRSIVLREHIHLIHAHAGLSSLGHEGILHSHLMGIRTVFTDHSLFGFDDAASILTNKLLAGTLRNVDAAIAVSHTGRENTVLRGELYTLSTDQHGKIRPVVNFNVYVIPNAIVAEQFRPGPLIPSDTITIVFLSRFAYRKGIDLLVASAPRICKAFPNVKLLVGGHGPKLIDLLQMREKHLLQDQIELLGPVRPSDVCSVLHRGSIYLNTSLTESFGIAILEAACAGLYVVSTRVGGVPEILPEDVISFAEPDEDDVFRAISEAISIVSQGKHDPVQAHECIKSFYDWESITERVERVYEAVMKEEQRELWDRMKRTMQLGRFAGPIYTIILIVDCLFFLFLEWWMPREDMDFVESRWDQEKFVKLTSSGGDASVCASMPDSAGDKRTAQE
ncbi:hypothetical protein D9758_002630 [Tetrapyrgos nigripes]|uniref:GlcNAc-PI synthesis protein n=1 Tax=Tetrapyrgos nigripes TaxID=182062 RepID=A0A8H5GR82_9AGAR|nr:hypothetical protein D9758_002630 [Tetrapyrgos nigripes]